jgi:hypothetical protein
MVQVDIFFWCGMAMYQLVLGINGMAYLKGSLER